MKQNKSDEFSALNKQRATYVKSKALMTDNAFKSLHKKNYSFNASKIFSNDTFSLFKNLKTDNIHLYKILLNEFLRSKGVKTEMEKLIWTSEFLEVLNNNHDQIMDNMNK
jgi:hypothetical protein